MNAFFWLLCMCIYIYITYEAKQTSILINDRDILPHVENDEVIREIYRRRSRRPRAMIKIV